jgi:eukaryotic-like serine/threonine-protein kinase
VDGARKETGGWFPARATQPEFGPRFEVVGPLGQGGMGSVYEVVDRLSQANLAVKALRRPGAEWVERFKQEFRSLQDLHHPNLVSLGELVEEQGRWFFTMEVVRGCNFLQYVGAHEPAAPSPAASTHVDSGEETTAELPALALGPVPAGQATAARHSHRHFDEGRLRSALGQLARGLEALHSAGKVHRDIKPSNLLITEQGRVVLLDFGVLASVGQGGAWGQAIVGTASYMAPEQATGAPPCPEADWYSVGVLLYEALTGHLPFSGPRQEVLQAKQHQAPLPPRQRVEGLPEDLATLCLELLEREPQRRPSGSQVLRRLGLAQEPSAPAALPFIGRQQELQSLQAALEQARQGTSQVVLVEGESGIGKSRLVAHFLQQVRERYPQALVLAGRCYERESVPYKGVDEVMEGLARQLLVRGLPEASALLPEGVSALTAFFPRFASVPGLGLGVPRLASQSEPRQQRVAAFLCLREVLARLARRTPVVLCVDDLQWADADGLALLDEVLEAPRLLLVATLRALSTVSGEAGEAQPPQPRFWSRAHSLPLQGLPLADARALVERLLGSPGLARSEHPLRIAEESAGQPLFIDTLVRYLQSSHGSPRPLRLEEALWARILQLEPTARRLLELLSIASAPLPQAVAAHATALDFSDYLRLATELRAAHLALTSGPAGTDMLEVVHDRVRQAVLEHVGTEVKQAWHARLATSLEALGQGGAEALARHWREAGQVERAVGYYLRAAREAGQALAFARQAALYGTVLGLGGLGEDKRGELLAARAEALVYAGRGPEAAETYLQAAVASPPEKAQPLRLRAGEQYLSTGHMEEGLGLMRQVLADTGLRYPESTARSVLWLLWLRLRVRLRPLQPRRALPAGLPPQGNQRLEATYVCSRALSYIDPLRAIVFSARYLLLALESDRPTHLIQALGGELLMHYGLSGLRASPRTRQLRAWVEELGAQSPEDACSQAMLSGVRAAEVYCQGLFDKALPHVERMLELSRDRRAAAFRADSWSIWVECTLQCGDWTRALRRLAQPLAEAREAGNRYLLALLRMGHTTLARLAEGDVEMARGEAEAGIAPWPREGSYVQHILYCMSQCHLDLYQGHSAPVVQRLREALPGWRAAWMPLLLRCSLREQRARALLMEAQRHTGSERARLLSAAEEDGRRLYREQVPMARAHAEQIRAGAATLRGHLPQALEHRARAVTLYEEAGMGLHAAAARWRQGELLGGEEGRSLTAAARAWMEAHDLGFPERLRDMLAPAGP